MKTLDEYFQTEIRTRAEHCERHGDFESRNVFLSVWSICPVCASERKASEAAQKAEEERAARANAWQRRLGESGIPERFRDRTLESFTASTPAQRKALDFAKAYAEGFDEVLNCGRCALFIGKPGTGKTHLAVGIGLQAMRAHRTVLFTTVVRAIRRVKDTWGRHSDETESDAIDALVFPDLLILDEVGVQFGSETEKLILFDVLNERYEKRRPTILLSNLTLAGVQGYLGERVFDRLREDGGEAVVFDWDSHRGRGRNAA